MRLTRQTNYAIRILMYCAANDGRLWRIPEIASAYSVSELFLFKILQPLVEHRLVETVRGRHGGVRLGSPADEITLFDVVRVTEESFAMAGCLRERRGGMPADRQLRAERRAARGAERLLRHSGELYDRRSGQVAHQCALAARHRPHRSARAGCLRRIACTSQ